MRLHIQYSLLHEVRWGCDEVMAKYVYIGSLHDVSDCPGKHSDDPTCNMCPGHVRSTCCYNWCGEVICNHDLFARVTEEQFENWRGFD